MKPSFDYLYRLSTLVCLLVAAPAWGENGGTPRGPERIVNDPLHFQVNYLYRSGGKGPLKPLNE